jgi:hypothetical protein
MGNYIDDNMKQQVVSNLAQQNRLGYILNYGIYGALNNDTIKKNIYTFFVAVRHKSYANASFTADDFKLPFYGNASYAGKTAQLSPFSYNNLSYQQIELGMIRTNIENKVQLGVGLSFLTGQQYMSVTAKNASLYTDTAGQYLTFNSNAQLYQSDTTTTHYINGFGASLDLFLGIPYKIWNKKGKLSISADDIGFIWWNNNSLVYKKDTSYTYSGFTINSLTDLQSAAFNAINEDSLQKRYFPETKKAFYAIIPSTLKISANTELTEKFSLEIGYNYIFNANYTSYFYIQANKNFNKGWIGSLQVGYGGYTSINGALEVTKQFKNCKLALMITHMQGIVIPNTFGGAGAYLGFTYLF